MRISAISRAGRSVYDRIQSIHEHEASQRRVQAVEPQEFARTMPFSQVMEQLQEDKVPRTIRVIEVLFAPGQRGPRKYRIG